MNAPGSSGNTRTPRTATGPPPSTSLPPAAEENPPARAIHQPKIKLANNGRKATTQEVSRNRFTRVFAKNAITKMLETAITAVGNAEYRAPEDSASDPGGPQADVFALGTLLHEMLAGAKGGPLPLEVPSQVAELIIELRDPEPGKRPTMATAAARLARLLAPHPLFAL